MKKMILAVGFTALLVLSVPATADTPASISASAELLARLEAMIPPEPAIPTPEVVRLIQEVGETKRLDAALILVRALAFSFSPVGDSESRSAFGLLPAAQALKMNFGSQVLPILMFTGVTSKESWLQTRLALTIREIGTTEEIQGLRNGFSTDESKSPIAKQFAARLMQPELSLAEDPVLSQFYELRKMYEEFLKREQEKPEDKDKPPARNAKVVSTRALDSLVAVGILSTNHQVKHLDQFG